MRRNKMLKQAVFLLLAAALFIPPGWSPPVAEAAAPQIGDVILAHDFEYDTQGWYKRGESETVTHSTSEGRAGTGSILSDVRNATWNGPGFNLGAANLLQKGATYEISAYAKLKEGTQGSETLQFAVKQTGAAQEYVNISPAVEATADDWVKITGQYTYDPQAAVLEVYLQSPSSATAAYYMDDFQVKLVSLPPDNGNGSGGTGPEPSDSVVWDFEDGTPTGWGPRGNETVAVTQEAAKSGSYSLKASDRSADWQGPSRDVKSILQKNKTYTLSAFVKLAEVPDTPSTIRLTMENKAFGAPSASYTTIAQTTTSGTDWIELRGTFSFTNDMETLKLYVETTNASDDFYVDDVKLSPPGAVQKDIPPLREVYKDDFEIGAAVEPQHLVSVHKELLNYHYNSIVAENVMKPESISPREGEYHWTNADQIANFARENNMNLRFHTLLWHQQGAEWMLKDDQGNYLEPTPENKALVLQRLETYLREVVGRYKDVARDWDVVNEVIDESRPDGMRDSYWYRLTGLDYIRTAFRVAREVAGPDAKLYINDYGTHDPKKRDYLFDLVTRLRDEGVPIDGVGHQTHINLRAPSVQQIAESIRKFGEAGFDNQITELDVSVYTNNTDAYPSVPQDLLDKQGYRYKELFETLKRLDEEGKQKGAPGGWISNVTFWGIADDHTWLHDRPKGTGRQDAPFPFDKQYQAKPAYWGMVDPSKLTIMRKPGIAVKGTPTVDGRPDFAWNLVPALKTEKIGALEAEWKTLWDDHHLYASVAVQDGSVSESDKVELFAVDGEGRKKIEVVRGAAGTRETAGGYVVEAAIPLAGTNEPGRRVYFDIRVTDAGVDDGSEHGKNGAIVSWSDPRSTQDADEQGYGILTFAAAPKSAQAQYGTPDIDGELDGVWSKASELATDVWVEGGSGSAATFRTLWDDQNLYVYAVVSDSLLSDASVNPWEQDSVEIFLDQNNGKTDFYEEDDGQYRIQFNNVRTVGGHANQDNYRSATRIVEGGYIVEAAMALDMISPQNGTVVGFDFQVNNDEDGDGRRDSVAIWSDPSGQSYQNTSRLGVLELIGKPGSGNTGGGNGRTGSPVGAAPPDARVETKDGVTKINVYAANTNGPAKGNIPNEVWRQALQQAAADADGKKRILVELPAMEGATSFEVQLPAQSLTGAESFLLSIDTVLGTMEIPGNMLAGTDIGGSETVSIRISQGSAEGLPASVRGSIGHRPIVALQVLAGGRVIAWHNPGAPVSVSLPYEPTPEELDAPDHIVVWRMEADGNATPLPNSRYDAENGRVRFQTARSGTFAAAFVLKTFDDLASVPWAKEAVEAMASRGAILGTAETTFSPAAAVRRADFLALLVRALELQGTGEDESMFSDVDPADNVYREVKIAKELGIVQGVGHNLFLPDAAITRQDMMALTIRALKTAGKNLEAKGALDAFSDSASVADYAKAGATALVSSGIVHGINGKIAPHEPLTRAQAAVILYRIWKN